MVLVLTSDCNVEEVVDGTRQLIPYCKAENANIAAYLATQFQLYIDRVRTCTANDATSAVPSTRILTDDGTASTFEICNPTFPLSVACPTRHP